MASGTYDIITIGGGLGGATLAKVMAEHGARVLVLEREQEFKDRVRGEIMAPWGVAEARELGIAELLRNTCAHELRWWDVYLRTDQIGHRDLIATTPQKAPAFTFYHPEDARGAAPSSGGGWSGSAPRCDSVGCAIGNATSSKD